MGAELIPFTRAVVTPEAQAAAQRSLASGWPATGPESFAHLMIHPGAEVQLTGMQKLPSLYDATSRNEAEAVRCYLQALLPDYHPQVPTASAQVAVPYADDY